MSLGETARALGLGDRGGRNSPFLRTVNRMVQFELARVVNVGAGELAVRRRLPPLTGARPPGSPPPCRPPTTAGRRTNSKNRRQRPNAGVAANWRSACSSWVRTWRRPSDSCCVALPPGLGPRGGQLGGRSPSQRRRRRSGMSDRVCLGRLPAN